MDKKDYQQQVMQVVHDCLDDESDTHHAVLITYNSKDGRVMTFSINAHYDIVQMLVTTAASFCDDGQKERVVN